MRFTVVILGWELDITLGPATAADEPGPGDRWMGFTGGWEGDGE